MQNLDDLDESILKSLGELEIIAKSLRNKGDLKESEKIFRWILSQYDKNNVKHYLDISRNLYEIAFIYRTQGKYADGAAYFNKSAHYSKLADDQVGDLIAQFWILFTEFHGYLTEASKVIYLGGEICHQLEAMVQGKRLERSTYNIIIHLFQVCVEDGNKTEAERYFLKYIDHSFHKEIENYDSEKIMKLGIEGQFAFVKGNWEEVINCLGRFLNIDIGVEQEISLVKISDSIHEMAREYWYLGRALEEMERKDQAIQSFNLGLDLPDDLRNRYFKEKIRKELKRLNRFYR